MKTESHPSVLLCLLNPTFLASYLSQTVERICTPCSCARYQLISSSCSSFCRVLIALGPDTPPHMLSYMLLSVRHPPVPRPSTYLRAQHGRDALSRAECMQALAYLCLLEGRQEGRFEEILHLWTQRHIRRRICV